MGNIVQLNEHLANMIAAGEVVEKTSSVVKELVENSIDAQSKKITINLIDSGIKLINVVDDGVGMSSEDANMAFMRHATSKIKTEFDLFRINTLGFRGEAIPSIASVSKMTLQTNNGKEGCKIVYKAGNKVESGQAACNKGTNISVEDLFFNTPARLKYLKSLPAELSSITYLVQKFALSRPDINFTLTNNQKSIIQVSGNNDITRLFGEIYGLEVAKNIMIKDYEGAGYKLKIVAVKPTISRSNKNEVTVITNNRYVKNVHLTQALIDAYQTYLPIGRYPIACIYLDIDPLLIDVNVHPSKTVIKISNEEELRDIIIPIVRSMLESTTIIPEIKYEEIKPTAYVKENIFDVIREEEVEYKPNSEPNKAVETKKIEEFIQVKPIEKVTTILQKEVNEEIEEAERIPYLEYVGQIHGTYLIFQNADGMYLVDQHAAAERINYEKYYEILKNPDKISIPLLLPYNIEFSKDEMLFIEEHIDEFYELGFGLEESGSNSYFVREIPSWVDFDNIEDFIRNLIVNFVKEKSINIIKNRDRIAKQIACKSSIKANHYLGQEEIELLMINLNKCKNPFTCPHGRPSIVKLSTLDLEKMFKRVM